MFIQSRINFFTDDLLLPQSFKTPPPSPADFNDVQKKELEKQCLPKSSTETEGKCL